MMQTWRPSASISALTAKSEMLDGIRQFFKRRRVMEVDVPLLSEFTVTDPHVDAPDLLINGCLAYLQSSPEYYMKRLLAAGSGAIYYLGKAFRCDQPSPWHRPEFTMLEWYRPGFDSPALMDEIAELCRVLSPGLTVMNTSYRSLFEEVLGINPHSSSVAELSQLACKKIDIDWDDPQKGTWLDVLFTHMIEPELPQGLVIVGDYPACQCALAQIKETDEGDTVADRFECYWDGVEIANGYRELTDADEQKRRFDRDNLIRKNMLKSERDIDPFILDALAQGLPDCSGVAMGVDRLLTLAMGKKNISEQLSF